ncbi:MAG: hypothetical protein V1655_03775 [bacterium]
MWGCLYEPTIYRCNNCKLDTSGIHAEDGGRVCAVCGEKIWHCPNCGYNGTAIDGKCPKCDTVFNELDGKNLKI